MSRRNRWLLVVAMLALLIAAYLAYLRAGDTGVSYEYASLSDARADDSVMSASIPDFVPPSAAGISGWYSVELDQQILEFSFNPAEGQTMTREFEPVTGDSALRVAKRLLKFRWKNAYDRDADLVIYARSSTDQSEYLLVDRTANRAYYVAERLRT